jgi:Domain of unknown function (DUF5710)
MFKWIEYIFDRCCKRQKEDFTNLPDLRIYIVVPYSKKDEARSLGAFWDPDKRKWYSPDSTYIELLSRFKSYESLIFKGEDRNFGGNILYIDMIPYHCHGNVRSNVSEEEWEAIKYTVRDRSNFVCELCGKDCKKNGNESPHCHERFSYNMNTKVQKLERFLCVCVDCHNVIHWGRSNIMGDGDRTREHLKKIRKMTDDEADSHIRNAYKLRWEREMVDELALDLSILENLRR